MCSKVQFLDRLEYVVFVEAGERIKESTRGEEECGEEEEEREEGEARDVEEVGERRRRRRESEHHSSKVGKEYEDNSCGIEKGNHQQTEHGGIHKAKKRRNESKDKHAKCWNSQQKHREQNEVVVYGEYRGATKGNKGT